MEYPNKPEVPPEIMQLVVTAYGEAVQSTYEMPDYRPMKIHCCELRDRVGALVAQRMGPFRFGLEYPQKVTPFHAAIHAMVDTVSANWRADRLTEQSVSSDAQRGSSRRMERMTCAVRRILRVS